MQSFKLSLELRTLALLEWEEQPMVKHGDVVSTVLNEFMQKLKEDPSIDAQVTESLQEILINKININENALKVALFDSHKENQS